jgi:hypothetical protein
MILKPPFKISGRLLPALQIGRAWVSIELITCTQARYFIDLPDGTEVVGDDLSCRAGITLQGAFESLLSFLGAYAEAIDYGTRTGRASENKDLFPASLADWATGNSDEIGMTQLMLSEGEIKYFD